MFKNIRSLFNLDEDDEGKDTGAKASNAAGKNKQAGEEPDTKMKTEKSHPKFTEILFQAMEVNNLDEFDYLEFKKSLKSLSQMPMEEATRYQSAFAVAQTMGVSVKQLLDTTQHYITVLEQEEEKFNKALAKQEANKIQSREDAIKALEKTISEKTIQIKKLSAEIDKHKAEVVTYKKEVNNATQKMEAAKLGFLASYNQLVSQIREDIEKMKQYLK